MGQNYSVTVENFKVKPGRENELVKAVHSAIQERTMTESCKQSILDANTCNDIIEAVFGPYVGTREHSGAYYGWKENGIWSAIFEGSYSWEGVMCDIFKIMIPYLVTGSRLTVYPDGTAWCIKAVKGKSVESTPYLEEMGITAEQEKQLVLLLPNAFIDFEVILEDKNGDYSFGVQSDNISHCLIDAVERFKSGEYAHVYVDGCRENDENVPIWSDGDWDDPQTLVNYCTSKVNRD